ncbi:conserved hypothetical protein [Uncinocarpus reesii 1704]|uniref:Pumilio homology domain family member 3 n=1 Tax=Uncinocarpus reesii (strain UAMH 1704) TaxID=336963 RepID=C4JR27_UNCRE|nr:uncharacterized protein UREG_03509 [Uncinocarpus reesii 1704]EEP78663.1 conserved hypothetical protein [Uncinocarpus reesii 1704]
MASGLSNGMGVHSVRGQSQRPHDTDSSNIGPAFGMTKPNWKGDLWSNPRLTDAFPDNTSKGSSHDVIEGKSGSGCLLATSESDGWDSRASLPWNVNGSHGHSLTPPGAKAQSRDSSPSYFASSQPAAIGTAAKTSTQRPLYIHSDPQSVAASTIGTPTPNGFINNNTPPRDTNMTFNHPKCWCQIFEQVNISCAGRAIATGTIMSTARWGLCNLTSNVGQPGKSMGGLYSHLSSNSLSTFSQRPTHSPHSSFHSNSDGNETVGSRSHHDLAQRFSKLDLEANGYVIQSQSASQRPAYVARSSFDGTFTSLQPPFIADELSVPAIKDFTLEPFSEIPMYQRSITSRHGERIMGSPSQNDYSRGKNPGFYSTHGTPPAPSRLVMSPTRLPGHYSDSQAAELLDRKLRSLQSEQQEYLHSSPMPNRRGLQQPQAFGYTNYHTGQMSQFANLYGMTPLSGISTAVTTRSQYREPDASQSMRSPLLDDFRANSKGNKRYELKDIYNHIVEFSGDQHGSRFIQQKLETANSDEKERVFQEIKPNAIQLMMDVFGNYVIQKLFEHGNQAQKKALAQQMMGHILNLSTQMYGCRVVQKALEHVLLDQQAAIVKELEHHVIKCVKDQNGNHVIQKAIERVPQAHIQFIINDFKGQIQRWAVHSYGCRVIQRMLEHCDEEDREAILAELHVCSGNLISDQFGNYVIQHVIENGKEKDRAQMIAVVISDLVTYSKHKFASNVVEKTIEFGRNSDRLDILRIFTTLDERGDPLLDLMRDQFGNYVVQKVLQVLKGDEYQTLVDHILPLLCQLKKFSFGKQIAAIEKHLGKQTPSVSSTAPNSNTMCPANDVDSSCEDIGSFTGGIPSSRGSTAPSSSTSIDLVDTADNK